MSVMYRILFIIIAVSMPAVCLIGAANIVFRMPDLYIYEFNKYQVSNEVDLDMKDDELGTFFSEFMTGKKDDFALFTEYRDREQSVFSTVEQLNMEHVRNLLNTSLFVFGGALALLAISGGIHLAGKRKEELRAASKCGILVYAILSISSLIAFSFRSVKGFLYHLIYVRAFGADDVLPQMLTVDFAKLSVIAVSVVSLVTMIILTSLIWRVTKPRRMFW